MTAGDRPAGLSPRYPIRTERLFLRPHRMSDLDDLARFHGDPEVVRFTPWPVRDRATTEQALRAKLSQDVITAPGQCLVLAVERQDTGAVIGEVLLAWTSAEHRQGEIGFAFDRHQQGRGFATEAAAAMLRLGFDELGLHRIGAMVVEGNDASVRVLHRLGFARQGRLVDDVLVGQRWATRLVYALREDEWRSGAEPDGDVEHLLGLVRCFFAAFTSGPGVDARLDALRQIMLPAAVVVRTCGQPPAVYGIESFIAPRRALLTGGSLSGFAEHAVSGRIDVFGDIAHWFGRYEKDGSLRGEPCPGAGMKSIQFVRTDEGWRISSAAWDDDRPGLGDHRSVDVTD